MIKNEVNSSIFNFVLADSSMYLIPSLSAEYAAYYFPTYRSYPSILLPTIAILLFAGEFYLNIYIQL